MREQLELLEHANTSIETAIFAAFESARDHGDREIATELLQILARVAHGD